MNKILLKMMTLRYRDSPENVCSMIYAGEDYCSARCNSVTAFAVQRSNVVCRSNGGNRRNLEGKLEASAKKIRASERTCKDTGPQPNPMEKPAFQRGKPLNLMPNKMPLRVHGSSIDLRQMLGQHGVSIRQRVGPDATATSPARGRLMRPSPVHRLKHHSANAVCSNVVPEP